MTHRSRALLALFVLALVAAACTGAEDTPTTEGSDSPADPTEDVAVDGAGTDDGDGATSTEVAIAPGADVDVEPEVLDAVGTWIAEESGLTEMLREEIFLERVTRTRDVLHLTFVQQHDEVSVRGAQFIVHVRETGEVIGASQSLTETLPGDGISEELGPEEAIETAEKAVPGPVVGEPTVTSTWLEVGTELRLGWEVHVTTSNPPSAYAVVVDATDGTVLSVDSLATSRGATSTPGSRTQVAQGGSTACDAPPAPSACIFVVDPIYASGSPTITPEQANQVLVGVPLPNLLDPGSGDLVGRYAQIAAPIADDYADPDGVFGQQGRGGQDITFEAGMTYYWIDYTQQVVQELGYDYHADDPVDFVPIEPEFPDNAFYLFTEDRIHMGQGQDGVNEAEDAQGIIHEYGHALLQSAVPNIVSEEGGAFHEGFADLVSAFTTIEFRNGDIGCLFHWAERGDCIRRLDTDLVYPDDLRFEVHLDGEIFTGAVWDVFEAVLAADTGLTLEDCQDRATLPCDETRDVVYGTLLGSLPFLTPGLTLNDAATAFAVSDQTFYGGANADIIAEVFAAHGLDATGSPAVQVEGLTGSDRSDAIASVKISHSYRGDLALRLDVLDASGGSLCAAELLSPDGEDDGDNITGRFQLAGTPCEEFLPPGPDQIWALTATDNFAQDEGTLFQFAIGHDGRRFLATGLPAVIPDADPIGVTATIGGPAPETMPGGDQSPPTPEPVADGTVTGDIQIAHTWRGDLLVQVVVADSADGSILCRVDVLEPVPDDDADDVAVQADLSECGALYPPSPSQAWVLRVADVAAQDTGEITGFSITGPDGAVHAADVPVAIPDADQSGVLAPIVG
ncbi:M36 family metallopeptidase [Euzebya sp.]|uniref:M36 family metallopeptidase n=1 Tax=Euzebya sp. TaxID=1971409 RepID=UPI00351436EB